jgi:arginyl-tRNA synthetase
MIKEILLQHVKEGVEKLGLAFPDNVSVENPPQGVEADLATNVAFQVARLEGRNPRELATELKAYLLTVGGIAAVDIAGPGFLNVTFDTVTLGSALTHAAGLPQYEPRNEKVIVEFISANPTGKLHIGNARGGPIGETISRVLEKMGYSVWREFYVNDIGGQAQMFAKSVLHFYARNFNRDLPFPEKGYPEVIVGDIVEEMVQKDGDKYMAFEGEAQIEAVRARAIDLIMAHNRQTIDNMGIHFDRYYPQSDLVSSGMSLRTLQKLADRDAVVVKEGATWLKSGLLAEDRETVLVKSNGVTTYFLDDIAYHEEKLGERGFSKAIVLLGANHFGHIPRMKASMQALGIDPGRYDGVLYQQVQLKRDGQAVKMAKREGNVVTADEVLAEIPKDVFSYFMLSKSAETHMDFDMQLAMDTSDKNPIYYIQYAHARIRSVLRLAAERSLCVASGIPTEAALSSSERALIIWIDSYGSCIEEVSATYRTHLLASYSHELANRFHHFYAHQRILSEDAAQSEYLLYLCKVTADTLQDALKLMNIEALDHM